MWTPQIKKPTLVTSLPEVEDLKIYIVHKQNKSVQNCFSVLFLKASLRGLSQLQNALCTIWLNEGVYKFYFPKRGMVIKLMSLK